MPQSIVNIYVHVIFSTKGREAMIKPLFEKDIYQRLLHDLIKMEVEVEAINGLEEHVHILLKLPSTRSISEVIRWCKGETSHWFNNKLMKDTKYRLYWQDGYTALSVSEKEVPLVKQYIENQKVIHESHAFAQEIEILKGKQK